MSQEKLKNLDDLFVDVLRDMYDAENQLVKALAAMSEAAHASQLKEGFKEHLETTKRQIGRLEQIFKEMKMSPQGKKCMGMAGLIKEGEEVMQEPMVASVRDAALIAAAQKVEHYEISGYGTARAYAEVLGHQNAMKLIEETLSEEGKTDDKLNVLAIAYINPKANK